MNRFLAVAFVSALVLGAGVAQAQPAASTPSNVDAAIEQLRKDARAETTDIITGSMEFSAAEAAAFWPLYKTYEQTRKTIGDEQVALVKDYAANAGAMTDDKAKDLLTRTVAIDDKTAAARKQFLQELQKALPAKRVARYYQVESRIELLKRLALAQEIPLVK
jgi:hypothetical protein